MIGFRGAAFAAAILLGAATPQAASAGVKVIQGVLSPSDPTFTFTFEWYHVGYGTFEFLDGTLESVSQDYSTSFFFLKPDRSAYVEFPYDTGCAPIAVGGSCSLGYDGYVTVADADTVDFHLASPNQFRGEVTTPPGYIFSHHRTTPGVSKFTFNFAQSDQPVHYRLTLTAYAVPEPSAWALMILGFGATGGMLRRRFAARALTSL